MFPSFSVDDEAGIIFFTIDEAEYLASLWDPQDDAEYLLLETDASTSPFPFVLMQGNPYYIWRRQWRPSV
jgi:hypothetical protein